MEIKYKNDFEDIKNLISYILYKEKLSKYTVIIGKAFVLIYPTIYGINNQNSIYFNFIIVPIIAVVVVFILLPKIEKKLIGNKAIKLFDKDKYFSSEKKIILNDKKVNIYCNNEKILIKLSNYFIVDETDKYTFLISGEGRNYKNKLIIPNSAFENEIEREKFVSKIKLEKRNILQYNSN